MRVAVACAKGLQRVVSLDFYRDPCGLPEHVCRELRQEARDVRCQVCPVLGSCPRPARTVPDSVSRVCGVCVETIWGTGFGFRKLGRFEYISNELLKHFPECTGSPAPSSTRRRLKQRYNLCNIGSNGHYELSGNCSITETITVKKGDVLEIIGVLGPNGTKPAIDGGGRFVFFRFNKGGH